MRGVKRRDECKWAVAIARSDCGDREGCVVAKEATEGRLVVVAWWAGDYLDACACACCSRHLAAMQGER